MRDGSLSSFPGRFLNRKGGESLEKEKLVVIYPQKRQKGKERERLDQILSYALENTQA